MRWGVWPQTNVLCDSGLSVSVSEWDPRADASGSGMKVFGLVFASRFEGGALPHPVRETKALEGTG